MLINKMFKYCAFFLYYSNNFKCVKSFNIYPYKVKQQFLPFIILSDIGVWPNFESGDIFVLVEDMNVVVRWNPEQGLTRL